MTLINEILDLAKIESGTMAVEVGDGAVREPARLRRPDVPPGRRGEGAAASRSSSTPTLPASIETDDMRLRQVLRNLLSNAIKFTERGRVKLRIARDVGDDVDRVLGRATPASASRTTSSG